MKLFFNFFIFFLLINSNVVFSQNEKRLSLIDNDKMIEYLNNRKVKYDKKDLVYIKDLKSFLNYNNRKLLVPDYFVYNKDLFLINQGLDKDECGSLFLALDETSLYKIDNNNTLDSFFKTLDFVDKNQKKGAKDFVVFITWGTFAHKNSNKDSFETYSKIKKKYGDRVQVYLLNLDLNESWNLTSEQKNILGV